MVSASSRGCSRAGASTGRGPDGSTASGCGYDCRPAISSRSGRGEAGIATRELRSATDEAAPNPTAQPRLAVCLGHFNGLDHFYTHTGKWLTSSSIRTRFVVKNFITNPQDLQPVLKELPPPDTPDRDHPASAGSKNRPVPQCRGDFDQQDAEVPVRGEGGSTRVTSISLTTLRKPLAATRC